MLKIFPAFQKKKNFCCQNCQKIKDTVNILWNECKTKSSIVFYYFSVEEEIHFLFENRSLKQLIDKYKQQRHNNADLITDFCDGTGYKTLQRAVNQYDINLIWNTDGVSPSKSFGVSFYPFQIVLREIMKPSLRSSFISVCGLDVMI